MKKWKRSKRGSRGIMVTQQTQHYLPRVYDDILRKRLAAKGAVLVEGPKWCGKTTTCERAANSVLYMANPVERSQNLLFAETQPSFLLEGTTPRLVDEWQIAPQLWDAVRFEVDQRNSFGQFILTGSSAPHISRRLEKNLCHRRYACPESGFTVKNRHSSSGNSPHYKRNASALARKS